MKELERIILSTTGQLGSLEDVAPVKRLTPQELRKLRLQAHQQTQIHFSLIRFIVKGWSDLSSALRLVFVRNARSIDLCRRVGHLPTKFGGIMHCRNCQTEILHIDQVRGIRVD